MGYGRGSSLGSPRLASASVMAHPYSEGAVLAHTEIVKAIEKGCVAWIASRATFMKETGDWNAPIESRFLFLLPFVPLSP